MDADAIDVNALDSRELLVLKQKIAEREEADGRERKANVRHLDNQWCCADEDHGRWTECLAQLREHADLVSRPDVFEALSNCEETSSAFSDAVDDLADLIDELIPESE